MLYINKAQCFNVITVLYIGMKMARHDKQLNVRMAHETINELKKLALANRRSLTAQLNVIVEDYIKLKQEENAKA